MYLQCVCYLGWTGPVQAGHSQKNPHFLVQGVYQLDSICFQIFLIALKAGNISSGDASAGGVGWVSWILVQIYFSGKRGSLADKVTYILFINEYFPLADQRSIDTNRNISMKWQQVFGPAVSGSIWALPSSLPSGSVMAFLNNHPLSIQSSASSVNQAHRLLGKVWIPPPESFLLNPSLPAAASAPAGRHRDVAVLRRGPPTKPSLGFLPDRMKQWL